MPDRKLGESLEQFAIRTAWEYGHFWSPDNPEGHNVRQEDLPRLKQTDEVVIRALRSLSMSDASLYASHVLDKHGRPPEFDGRLGPALQAMIDDPRGRCPIPDYAPPLGVEFAFEDPGLHDVVATMQQRSALPATGSGNWQSCHGIGQFHCASVRVNPAGMPTFLKPLIKTVLTRVQAAYAGVGLLFRFVDMNKMDLLNGQQFESNINSEMSFVGSSSGWIGLAIVGTGERCGGNIWCKFLATYRGGQTDEQIVTQWTTLIKHELGHNCGKGHTNGGVMNPSIVNGLAPEWSANDPTTPWLKQQFGGVPVPIGGGSPGPTPKPPATDSVQSQLDSLRLQNVVQDVSITYLIDQIRKLKGGGQ